MGEKTAIICALKGIGMGYTQASVDSTEPSSSHETLYKGQVKHISWTSHLKVHLRRL